ncbi:hypothetical protein [Nostoc parmelioides]|uniref:Uncharacterized protein n=1 Tax=Nostoc parmelioides FACHB-3921 TaxID=2692909 RepID=A0ABR8BE72_9NOSO|nr:hypothetical protein [Nostoc parmelioides]MBD2251989.1 hypothetical protein [Nostoc parmelioides FACHB-3921]
MQSWKPNPQDWIAIAREQGGTIRHRLSVIGQVVQNVSVDSKKTNEKEEKVTVEEPVCSAIMKLFKEVQSTSDKYFNQTQTQSDCTFYFKDLPEGNYRVEVELSDKKYSSNTL